MAHLFKRKGLKTVRLKQANDAEGAGLNLR